MQRDLDLPQEFIDYCRSMYEESKTRLSHETEIPCEIPTNLYWAWYDEGFDAADYADNPIVVIQKLRREGLDYLVTSSKFDLIIR